MKKVLVTGGTGFVGQAVLEFLEQQDIEVHLISTKNYVDTQKRKYYRCDIMNYKQVNILMKKIKPEYLIHLAWNVEHENYLNSSENLLWVAASLNLLKAFKENDGKRVIMCGTCFEYSFEEKQLKEEDNSDPLSLYAVSKAALHDIAKKYADEFGISFLWCRLFYIFGENEKISRVVPYVITELLKGNKVTCRNSSAIRDYMYVKDAGKAIVKTLFSPVKGEVNIASGNAIKMEELFRKIAVEVGNQEKVNLEDKAVIPQSIVADVDKLKNQVKYDEFTDINIALRRTIEWWRKNEY